MHNSALTSNGKPADKKKILVVDDDKSMVDAIRRFLIREKNYELEVAHDGVEACVKFSTFQPDLVLLDIKMPGLDGFKVCSQIRNEHNGKGVKIILISGIIDHEQIGEIKKSGADDFLSKPFKSEALRSKIEELLSKQVA